MEGARSDHDDSDHNATDAQSQAAREKLQALYARFTKQSAALPLHYFLGFMLDEEDGANARTQPKSKGGMFPTKYDAVWYRNFFWRWVVVLCVVATAWTTPWDNYLIYRGVWGYDAATTAGQIADTVLFRIWYVPIEEHAFFILETIVVALLWLLRYPDVDAL